MVKSRYEFTVNVGSDKGCCVDLQIESAACPCGVYMEGSVGQAYINLTCESGKQQSVLFPTSGDSETVFTITVDSKDGSARAGTVQIGWEPAENDPEKALRALKADKRA